MAKSNQTNPSDSIIERSRIGRLISVILSPILALIFLHFLGRVLFGLFYLPPFLGGVVGLSIGNAVAIYLVLRSFIYNEAVQAFVTVNPLASLFSKENVLVSYGPGTHLCYWWEQRLAGYNVLLNTAAENMETAVQASNGTLFTKASTRLRPDLTRLPQFLSGVASAPAELTGLIQQEINVWLAGKTVEQALATMDALNKDLQKKFVDSDHEIEQRYGIIIDDVTVNEILPSKELQETMGALFESETIDMIVAKSFGYANAKTLQAAIKKGSVASEEVNRRRTQTIAMSGNLQGMNLNSSDFNLNIGGIKDIPPELIQAFGTIAQSLNNVSNMRSSRPHTPKTYVKKGGAK